MSASDGTRRVAVIGSVRIETREDALTWKLVDAAFCCDRDYVRVIELCRQCELDLYRERAEAVLENDRRRELVELLHETDPARVEEAIA